MLLDNLYIILINLSTAALPHLNRLMADRSFNLLLNVIFHTWLLHGRQIADDPITNTFDTACTVEMSKLKDSYCGGVCLLLTHEGGVPETKAPEQVRRPRSRQNSGAKGSPCFTCHHRGCQCPAWASPAESPASFCVRVSSPLTGQAGGDTPKHPCTDEKGR